jgi:hypothetical protein
VQEEEQVPMMQGMERSHCSPTSRRLLPQSGIEGTEDMREDAREDVTAKQRQRVLLQEKPRGQGYNPDSHSSMPSSRPLPQRAAVEDEEE